MTDRNSRAFVYLLGVSALCLPTLISYIRFVEPDELMGPVIGFFWLMLVVPAIAAGYTICVPKGSKERSMEDRLLLVSGLAGILAVGGAYYCAEATTKAYHSGPEIQFVPILTIAVLAWAIALATGWGAPLRITRWLLRTRRPRELQMQDMTAAAPAPRIVDKAPPGGIPAEGALVEEGSFTVDEAHALEKLREYRLADPDAVLLPLLRCAVASKAELVSIDRTPEGLRLTFDGDPLPPASLEAPMACIFEEDSPERERSLDFAYGLLGILRHRPNLVRVASGRGPRRAVLRMGPLKDADPEFPAQTETTVVDVVLSGWFRRWRSRKFLLSLAPLFPPKPVELMVDGKRVPCADADWEARTEQREGLCIALRPAWTGASEERARFTRLYKHGVFVCELRDPDTASACEALVNDDLFALDISGSQVVQDERFRSTMARLEVLRRDG